MKLKFIQKRRTFKQKWHKILQTKQSYRGSYGGDFVCSLHFSFNGYCKIAHFTVTGGNEAGVDLVLIQLFQFYYINHVLLMLNRSFQVKFTLENWGRKFVSKQGQPQPQFPFRSWNTKPATVKWPIGWNVDRKK